MTRSFLRILFAALPTLSTIARDLPDAFLEYVEATGAQRVLTDYRPTGDTIIKAVFTPTDVSTKGYLFRAASGLEPPNATEPIFNFLWAAKGAASLHYDKNSFPMDAVAAGHTYSIEAGNFSATLYSNSAAVATAAIGRSSFKAAGSVADNTGGKIVLFAFHRYGYAEFVGSLGKVRLHSMRVYEREKGVEVMKREFLPCLKDGVAQLYDTVTGAFFASATSTALVAGPAVGTGCYSVTRSAEIGSPAPACGVHAASAGDPLSFATTATIADASGRATWNCTGYTIAYADGTETTGSGNSVSFSYSQPFVLTWNYERVRTAADAVTWYVAPLAEGETRTAPTGATPANAFFRPQDALEAAATGDTVLFAPGTYPLLQGLTVDKAITLTSTAGAEATVIDGVTKTFRILNATAAATIEGLSLTRGGGNVSGAGMCIAGGAVARNCIITNNAAGTWCTGGAVRITDGTVSRCLIANNTVGSYSGAGAGLEGNGAVLEHCLVAGNSAGTSGNAGGVWLKYGTVRNCTIVANTANTGGGVHFEGSGGGGTRVFVNNIVYGNTVIADTSAGAPEWTKSYTTAFKMTNNFFAVSTVPGDNRTVGEATLTGNPFFADFAGGDYHLTPSSPCLDAGWGEASIDKDLDGNARVSGPAMDIGCYEYDQSVLSASFDYVLGDATATFTVTGIGFDPADADCYWSFDGTEPTPARHDGTGAQYVLGVSPGDYTVGCAVYLNGEKVYGEVKPALFRVYPARLYVRTDNAAPAAPYDTWARAATNILDAIEWARRENAVVTVSNGTYATSGTIILDTPVTLQSLNGPEVTILDGGLHHRVVQINSTRAVVAGFAIQNGKGGTDNGDGGGGTYLAGGILTNCIVRGCTGAARVTGAGVVAGGGLVTGCVITNNSVAAWAAAGIFVKNGARLENSLVADNRCTLGVGGIRIADGHVKSCTIAGNTGNGPGFHRNSTANYGSVVNTVIYGNTDTSGGANPDFNDFPTRSTNVWSSAAFGVVAGGGEPLVGDPKFRNPAAGDYRLKVSSPCRNKAWGALSGTSVDLLGAPRIHGKAMDIGCYEVQLGTSTLLLVQ